MTYCNTERRPRKMLWATSSKQDLTSWLWLVSILWPRRLRCCDRNLTTARNTSLSFYLRVSKSAGKLLHIYMFTKAKHKNRNGSSQLWTSSRNSYSGSAGYRPKVYTVHLSDWYIRIFCPRVSTTINDCLFNNLRTTLAYHVQGFAQGWKL